MTTADTFEVRDQLIAVLREASAPMSTADLAKVLPWQVHRLELGCDLVCWAPITPANLVIVECHGDWHVVSRPRSAQDARTGIYRHLRSLARTGVVRAISKGPRRVEWTFVQEPPGGKL